MNRRLTPGSTLDTVKKEAKRWLKALRAGDPGARERLLAATPAAPAAPGLRDVQLALAREHGLAGWTDLRRALEDLALARRARAERVAIVLRSAWGGDPAAAARVLARSPEIGADDIHIAVATGNRAEVERRLAADPAAASRAGGPLDWVPLLYLAYARLPGGDAEALAIVRLLLDHGADPDARFKDDWDNPFTALTGVIGEGEGDRPAHPRKWELASLLIERGADPYDTQALYNTSVTRDDTSWLEFLWSHCERRGSTGEWTGSSSKPSLGGRLELSTMNYLLGNAVSYNHVTRAGWLLAHGASPNTPHAYSGRPVRDEALVHGHTEVADLLARNGADAAPLTGHAAFQVACLRLDRDQARALVDADPSLLQHASAMLVAAAQGRVDVVALLLELGVDVNVADGMLMRGLHRAAAGGSVEVARLLTAHGADVDRPTLQYGGAMSFARHFGQREVAAFLAPLSRDVHNLVQLALTDRLRELFAAEPELANAVQHRTGLTPLFTLPDDEDEAAEVVELLLAHGADPRIPSPAGETAEQAARRRGLEDAADLMSVILSPP